jgi:hypothetical protein
MRTRQQGRTAVENPHGRYFLAGRLVANLLCALALASVRASDLNSKSSGAEFPHDWLTRESGITGSLNSVTYANGQFVAVGDGILTSPDGAIWTQRMVQGTIDPLYDLSYGEGLFVAVGGHGLGFPGEPGAATVLTSPDGVIWIDRTAPATNALLSVAYGNGTFVAVGSSYATIQRRVILTSLDGINWSERTSPGSGFLTSVAFGGETFAAVGPCSNLLTSLNGLDWTDRSGPGVPTFCSRNIVPSYIAYGAGRWLAVGTGIFGCGADDCPGVGGDTHRVGVSANLADWSPFAVMRQVGTSARVRFVNGFFVSTGGGACCHMLSYALTSSTDGIAWSEGQVVVQNPNRFHDVAFGNGSYVVVGDGGAILHAKVNRPPAAVANVSPLFAISPGDTNQFILALGNVTGVVILDGSQSSDPDNDPLQFFWYADGQTNALAAGPTATNEFTVGLHTVMLLVSDGQDTATAQVNFEVITPGAAVGQLAELVKQVELKHTQSLLASLSAAQKSFDCGNITAALNQLSAFQNKARAQIPPSNSALADEFTSAAQKIINVFSGT